MTKQQHYSYDTTMSISVVLPAYNEEDNIYESVIKSVNFLQQIAHNFEVIVVNDGSTDQTLDSFKKAQTLFPNHIKIINHPKNLGYGAALRNGFLTAKGDYIFYTDSDNQFDIRELRDFLPHMKTHDMVVGFRIYRYDTVLRCLLSWIYNRLISILFKINIRDVDCAFKLFKKEIFNHLIIQSNNFFVDAEIVGKARKLGFSIYQRGVRHYPRLHGTTTVRPSDIPRTLREMAKLYIQIRKIKKIQ